MTNIQNSKFDTSKWMNYRVQKLLTKAFFDYCCEKTKKKSCSCSGVRSQFSLAIMGSAMMGKSRSNWKSLANIHNEAISWWKWYSFRTQFCIQWCLIHPIFSSFGFWNFGHFSFVIFFPFFCLTHLALQNVNKDYVIKTYRKWKAQMVLSSLKMSLDYNL